MLAGSERHRGGDGGVPAERHLGERAEITHPEAVVRVALGDESGLRVADVGRDGEHFVVGEAGRIQHDAGGVAAFGVVAEGGVSLDRRHTASLPLAARHAQPQTGAGVALLVTAPSRCACRVRLPAALRLAVVRSASPSLNRPVGVALLVTVPSRCACRVRLPAALRLAVVRSASPSLNRPVGVALLATVPSRCARRTRSPVGGSRIAATRLCLVIARRTFAGGWRADRRRAQRHALRFGTACVRCARTSAACGRGRLGRAWRRGRCCPSAVGCGAFALHARRASHGCVGNWSR